MKSFEARDLLLAVAAALRAHPPSFTFELRDASEGAAPGDIAITQRALGDDMREKVLKAAHDIDLIANEVERDKPDRGTIERLFEQLPEQAVGAVVPTLVAAILAACS